MPTRLSVLRDLPLPLPLPGMTTNKDYFFPDLDPTLKALARLNVRQIRRLISRNEVNKYPLALYKFRPIEEVRLRPFLLDNELYLSSRKQFNDPFDATLFPVIPVGGARRIAWANSVARNVGASYKGRKEFIAKMHDPMLASNRIRSGIETHLNKAGVFSFAGDPRDILMWSHYANSHHGVCLRFEVARDVETFLHALPVEYTDEYPVIELMSGEDASNLINKVPAQKGTALVLRAGTSVCLAGGCWIPHVLHTCCTDARHLWL